MGIIYFGSGLILLIALWYIWAVNNLIAKRNRVKQCRSGICVALKQRNDMIPNLVAAVKSYMGHENEILTRITELRSHSFQPSQEAELYGDYGCLITNPPYGERLGEVKDVENMYRALGGTMNTNKTWSTYVITSMEYFEKLFGRRADAKRKLFNGRIKIDYYQFYGPRPPKKDAR